MPWTRDQVKYLLGARSPLSSDQKASMKSELHKNPALGYRKKGYKKKKSYQLKDLS